MNILKPNEQRSKNAILLIWIVVTIQVIMCISDYMQLNLLQSVADGLIVSDADADANDSRQFLIASLFLIFYIVSAVTFIQWFRRAYFNLHTRVKGLSNAEGWAAGAWFVPVISLFKPYQIMKEMNEKTDELILENGLNTEHNSNPSNSIALWWALWIVTNVIAQISFRLPSETLEQLITSTTLDVYSILVDIPLAIITIKVIKDYSQKENLIVNVTLKDDSLKPQTIVL